VWTGSTERQPNGDIRAAHSTAASPEGGAGGDDVADAPADSSAYSDHVTRGVRRQPVARAWLRAGIERVVSGSGEPVDYFENWISSTVSRPSSVNW